MSKLIKGQANPLRKSLSLDPPRSEKIFGKVKRSESLSKFNSVPSIKDDAKSLNFKARPMPKFPQVHVMVSDRPVTYPEPF